MNTTLPANIEHIGRSIIINCYFSVGYMIGKETLTLKEQLAGLEKGLLETIDDLRTDMIHYDCDLEITYEDPTIIDITKITPNNKLPITLYEEEDALIGEVYIGNSLFIESGSIKEAKEKMLKDLKDQVSKIYNYLGVGQIEFVKEEEN